MKAKLLHTLIKANNNPQYYSSIHSEEGLMHKMWAIQIFHGGKSTFINLFHVSLTLWNSNTVSLEIRNNL